MSPRRALAFTLALLVLPSCSAPGRVSLASCDDTLRLGLVAQSVPTASYVPCLASLPAGWSVQSLEVRSGRTRFELLSDRAQGRSVVVALTANCDTSRATAESAPAVGVRRYLQLSNIAPRYAGTRADVFTGGCVTYSFDFARGEHIVLLSDLASLVGLQPRREVRRGIRDELGRELDR